ncbi:hypothetical protein DL96DRAFT_1720460 [Flagelloscypha sp. PMI_526]|nr:hypothetical protein DL96DRAFT_1720460 [Flagelloscypha sp. PMI_526]
MASPAILTGMGTYVVCMYHVNVITLAVRRKADFDTPCTRIPKRIRGSSNRQSTTPRSKANIPSSSERSQPVECLEGLTTDPWSYFSSVFFIHDLRAIPFTAIAQDLLQLLLVPISTSQYLSSSSALLATHAPILVK